MAREPDYLYELCLHCDHFVEPNWDMGDSPIQQRTSSAIQEEEHP